MNICQVKRYMFYCSMFGRACFELYSLKKDHKYARQRFCSIKYLQDNNIIPSYTDYELRECGFLSDDESLERMIANKNTFQKNYISVGDIVNVIQNGKQTFFFVDGIGLQTVPSFRQ